ncbi:hypothetical protein IG631_20169 [Alternaria alternata]|nr:hypothetical protein IG631_20169 [Alternaria alternata]
MDNSNLPLSFSPSQRRCEESDHPGQSASRSDSVASSQRTVSTVADSTNQSSSPSRHLTELRTVQPSVSATTTKRFPGNMPHNTWLEYSVAQTQTPQISRSNTNADESPSPVQQPSDHGSSEISAGVLTKTPLKRRVLLYGDILFSLTPLFFLGEYLKTPLAPPMLTKGVLASLSLYLNHQSKSTFGDKVKTTTSLSPTIFPIVYAAIVGTVLQRIGLYKAERSATVGTSKQTINSSMDLWGNVKLPNIKSLRGYEPSNPIMQWYEVGEEDVITYASLLGTPIIGMPESSNTSFSMVSFYWSVECDAARIDPVGPWKQATLFLNTTCPSSEPIWTFDLKINSSAKDTAFFTYQSRKSDNLAQTNSSTANCRAEALVVESSIECVNKDCGVRAMRRLSRDHVFSFDRSPASLFLQTAFLVRADLGATQSRPRQNQLTEFFIVGWENTATRQDEGWVEIANITAKALSNRLQIAVNTFWDASIGNGLRTANLSLEQPPSVCPLEYTETCAESGYIWNTTTIQGRRFDGEQYICNIPFAIIVIFISCFLFLAADVSTILGIITTAPDILGYVSTAARDNPYFEGYAIPSHFDGMEATRYLRDVRVMIGDVKGKSEIGHVAFTPMDTLPQRLAKRKLYG